MAPNANDAEEKFKLLRLAYTQSNLPDPRWFQTGLGVPACGQLHPMQSDRACCSQSPAKVQQASLDVTLRLRTVGQTYSFGIC